VAVRDDCRHFLQRTTRAGDAVLRCRLSANQENPFACPDGCLFFESRTVLGAGWAAAPTERMSNTADGLDSLPESKRRRRRKR
jgi:hypothetical protein